MTPMLTDANIEKEDEMEEEGRREETRMNGSEEPEAEDSIFDEEAGAFILPDKRVDGNRQ